MMMIIHSLVKIITTHTHTHTHMNTKKFYSAISCLLRTFATFCYNNIQETTSTLPRDACIKTHTHAHTYTLIIPNTNFTHTYTSTQKSHTNLNVNIHLTVFFDFLIFFDFSNILLHCPMIVVIRRHETLTHR